MSNGLEDAICPECERGGKIVLIDDDDEIVSCGYCGWSGKVCQLEWR